MTANLVQITDSTLAGRFSRGLALSPERPAVRADGGVTTFRELHERALLLAGSALAGLAEDTRTLGVLVGKGTSAYATLLAGFYSGLTVVPLQPAFPAARTRQMIEAAGVQALLADDDSLPALRALADEGVELPTLFAPGGHPAPGLRIDPGSALTAPMPTRPHDVAYVLFTSGSTGRPKGVPVTHANTAHYFALQDKRYDFGPEDVFSQTFDLNFDCAMFDLFCAWGAGAPVVPLPPQAYARLPEFLSEHGITVWFSTPSAISLVRKTGGLQAGSLSTLRWSFFAGEALHDVDAADWAQAASRSTLENLYGPTELTITVSAYRWCDEERRHHVVPIGELHEGHDLVLLDDNGRPSRTGEGELCVAGPQLTAGYLDPADDVNRFLVHEGKRFYRTGDRVRLATDGAGLLYLGRRDSQVQVHGIRVELAEVDAAVRDCEGVDQAVTVALEMEGTVELAVFHTGEPLSPARLARHLRDRLPSGVVPRAYYHIDAFPLNSNRKIDRSKLTSEASGAAVRGRPRPRGGR
ncbi:AMP-binding protein [Lentzea chajnantorensis]